MKTPGPVFPDVSSFSPDLLSESLDGFVALVIHSPSIFQKLEMNNSLIVVRHALSRKLVLSAFLLFLHHIFLTTSFTQFYSQFAHPNQTA